MLELLEKDDSEEVEDKEEITENLYSKIGELYSCPEEGNVYRYIWITNYTFHGLFVLLCRTYFLSPSCPDLSVSMRESKSIISDGTTGRLLR